jgi:hypothetical protein
LSDSPNSDSQLTQRTLVQRRILQAEVYKRPDGLWDIESSITDTKGKDFKLMSGLRELGTPVHQMKFVITIDLRMNIVAVIAEPLFVAYPGFCEKVAPEYQKLLGLNLLDNFKNNVKERLGGMQGCTHMTELCSILPTVAIQAFVGEVDVSPKKKSSEDLPQELPFQYNRCFALKTDGEAVKTYHPKWYGFPVKPGRFVGK